MATTYLDSLFCRCHGMTVNMAFPLEGILQMQVLTCVPLWNQGDFCYVFGWYADRQRQASVMYLAPNGDVLALKSGARIKSHYRSNAGIYFYTRIYHRAGKVPDPG